MKRMFVATGSQGLGIGKALAVKLIDAAKSDGYQAMRLDTAFRQVEAHALYRGLGFRTIEPYYEAPEGARKALLFMELTLRAAQ